MCPFALILVYQKYAFHLQKFKDTDREKAP